MSRDLIDRQAVIDMVRNCNVKEVTPAYMLIDKAETMTELMMLPSIEPERKKGHWIYYDEYAEAVTHTCSECGKRMTTAIGEKASFCWNCGADMRGEQDG